MRLRELHPALGVEVLDFDPQAGGSPAEIEALRAAYDARQLLLFRGQRALSPERQVEISGWFGPPIANGPDGVLWSVLHNDEAAGRLRLPFHSDLSYTEAPILGLSLHALEIPAGGTATAFVSGVHAWRNLNVERRDRLAGKTLRHRLAASLTYGDWPEFLADHPMRLVHPRTGAEVLYVTEHHAHRILEMEEAESDRVLAELYAHLYAPAQVYTHRWRPFDLLVWDNLAVQHARPETAEADRGARAMQRVTLAETPYFTLVERARRQEAERRGGAVAAAS